MGQKGTSVLPPKVLYIYVYFKHNALHADETHANAVTILYATHSESHPVALHTSASLGRLIRVNLNKQLCGIADESEHNKVQHKYMLCNSPAHYTQSPCV